MLQMSPAQMTALYRDAQALYRKGRLAEARQTAQKLALAAPRHPDVHHLLSQIAYDSGDRDTCLKHLRKALKAAPGAAPLWSAAAARLRALNEPREALAAYDHLIGLDRKAIAPRAEKAHYLQLLGRFGESETQFRKLIAAAPHETELYRMFLGTKKLTPDDPLLAQMETLWRDARVTGEARMHLGFALAKAMDDTGQHDRTFVYLDAANGVQRDLAPYDPEIRRRELAGLMAAQDSDLTPLGDPPRLRPVFVTGLPRSGTTLVEQILGAHSAVTAGGELGHVLRQAYARLGAAEHMTPLDQLTPAALRDFADGYLRMVRRDLAQERGVFTDKSIQTNLVFGLLHRALPGARFVVVHRDPRDIALSIYRNPFRLGTHRYACDFADIAEAIRQFRHSIALWQDRLPGVLHEVHYEDLVSDPEPQARALVAAAGLDWEDACLSFHERRTTVKTLSVAQVREPIHARRRAAWERYATQMQPFFDAWGDAPWD